MKKFYLSFLSMALLAGAHAQSNGVNSQKRKDLISKYCAEGSSNNSPTPAQFSNVQRAPIWSDDFSTPANWVMTNTSAPTSYNWTITNTFVPVTPLPASLIPPVSTTAANGFALIDSDGQPGNADGNGAIVAQMTNATPIDLTGYPNVILKFEHSYRWWQDSRGVRVSGDNGATWTDFPITSEDGGVFPNGYPNDQNSANPEVEYINISAVAGDSSQVLVQFYYNDHDIWAWYWVVDDVEILEQPANDIELQAGWFAGTNNEGIEYGRTPFFHLDDSYIVGAQVYNFGTDDQTNIAFDADFTSFTSNGTDALVEADSTIFMEQTETPTLAIGVYNGTYTVTSDLDTVGGASFANNVYERNFEITEELYSQDGIGIHPASELNVGFIGTGSFLDAEDGLVLAAMYHIKGNDDVVSITVMLDPSTVAGGTIDASIRDTALFIAGDLSSALYYAPSVTVTATDISNGYITINFPPGASLTPGAYYAAIELFSNAGANDIWVLDDRTIPQPGLASAIYIPSDQTYTNGVSFGIRLRVTGGDAGIEEGSLVNVSVYPNPASSFVNVNFDIEQYHNASIQMVNASGQAVYSSTLTTKNHQIDLQNIAAGVYLVKIIANEGTIVRKVVVSK